MCLLHLLPSRRPAKPGLRTNVRRTHKGLLAARAATRMVQGLFMMKPDMMINLYSRLCQCHKQRSLSNGDLRRFRSSLHFDQNLTHSTFGDFDAPALLQQLFKHHNPQSMGIYRKFIGRIAGDSEVEDRAKKVLKVVSLAWIWLFSSLSVYTCASHVHSLANSAPGRCLNMAFGTRPRNNH